jgi:diadenosine tetraphosphate (Ap4A) HIT family hydrolase
LAPYSNGHLLVIPKRHIKSLLKMTKGEGSDILDLLNKASKIMDFMNCKNYSILVREGALEKIGKSIDHLHYHIIPDHRIGDLDTKGRARRIMTEQEIDDLLVHLNKFK